MRSPSLTVAEPSGALTTAPLDTFESLGGWTANDPKQSAFFTSALTVDAPLMLLRDLRHEISSHLVMEGLIDAVTDGFPSFCMFAAPRWRELRDVVDSLSQYMLATRPTNSHILLRLLRDHWFWQWFEILKTAVSIFYGEVDRAEVRVEYWAESPISVGGVARRRADRSEYVLAGPTLVVADEHLHGDVEAALAKFCQAIDGGWASIANKELPKTIQSRSGRRFPLYTTAVLVRAAGSRPRVSWAKLGEAARLADVRLGQLTELSVNELPRGPYRSMFRAAALISSFEEPEEGGPRQIYDLPVDRAQTGSEPCLVAGTVPVPLTHEGPRLCAARLEHLIDLHGPKLNAAWRSHIQESKSIASGWLNRGLWERVFVTSEAEEEWGDLGRRLTRFLANAFIANECALYRVDYRASPPRLVALGGYSDDRGGSEKVRAVARFMNTLSAERRSESICYRALDRNIVEYVEFEDPEAARAVRRLAFPDHPDWTERGRSAVAVPIRVNGAVWGVVELISFNYSHFPFAIRSQIGEMVDTIGNALSFHNVSALLNYIDRITAGLESTTLEKRDQIVARFQSFFMASDVALIRMRRGGSDDFEPALVAAIGAHPRFGPTGELLEFLKEDLDSLVRTGSPVFLKREGKIPETSGRGVSSIDGEFVLIALSGAQSDPAPNVLCLRFPTPVFPEAGWHRPFQVLGEYVLNAVDTLEAEVNWARHRRSRYGHEMLRNITTIDDVGQRIRSNLGRDRLEHDLAVALSDLTRARTSLKLYADALTDATLLLDSREDPRIAAMRRHINLKSRWPALDVREVFNSAVYSRRKEAQSVGLSFLAFPHRDEYPHVHIDDVLIYEVFSTLADNAIKYSVPKSTVQLGVKEDHTEFSISVSNIGAELSQDESHRIFEDTYRGRYARRKLPEGGRGLGLGYARALMEMFDGDLTYRQRLLQQQSGRVLEAKIDGFNLRWHHFIVTFPRGILRRVR